MAFEIRKAERRKAKARVGIGGPSGSGKTASALLIAYGLTGAWEDIGLIDTENGSGELYVNADIGGIHIGEYNYGRIIAPFTPQKYVEAIKAFENAGMKVIIIDSLTHAWAGEGGLLETHGRLADSGDRNSYAAWRKITPQHNQLVEAMLQSKCHVIVTIRAKTEYSQEVDSNGKKSVKKVGMGLVQRDGMDYEFTIMLDVSYDHIASVSKDRTSLFDGTYFKPTVETGKALLQWLETGTDTPEPTPAPDQPPAPPTRPASSLGIPGPKATPPTTTEGDADKLDTADAPPTEAECTALLDKAKHHKDGGKAIVQALYMRGMGKLDKGTPPEENHRTMMSYLLAFKHMEFDALARKVAALPIEPPKEERG